LRLRKKKNLQKKSQNISLKKRGEKEPKRSISFEGNSPASKRDSGKLKNLSMKPHRSWMS
jgi:hypothetical protein